jgi:hypothetical protein
MSKAQGAPLSMRSWQAQPHGTPNSATKPRQFLTKSEKGKVMKQLGAIVSQLSSRRLDKIGSLFEEEGCYTVKACLSPGHVLHERHTFREIYRGPFDQESDYYRSLLSAFLLHIQFLPMSHHIFFAPVPVPPEYRDYASYLCATDRWNDFITVGSKIDSSTNRLNYFIASQFLETMIPSFTSQCEALTAQFGDGFPLRHPDLSMNNIFVDDDCNITCIIDWAFSCSVPIGELLTTPGLPHPRDQPESAFVTAFRAGFMTQAAGEGEEIYPSIWDIADKVWHFMRLVNFDALQDCYHFTALYSSVFGNRTANIPTLFRDQHDNRAVSNMAKILWADDQSWSEIKRNEDAYFLAVGCDRHAAARKLTVASELSRVFIADKKLWRWIEDALDLDMQ